MTKQRYLGTKNEIYGTYFEIVYAQGTKTEMLDDNTRKHVGTC